MTYAILIYEIVSCICRYVFHINDTCKFSHEHDMGFFLEFFVDTNSSLDSYIVLEKTKYSYKDTMKS